MEQHEIDRLKAENARLKAENAQAKQAENKAFLDDLTKQGKLIPAMREKAEKLLNFAEQIDQGEPLNFSEGESLAEAVKAVFSAMPPAVIFGEIATPERAGATRTESFVNYSENTPPEMIELDQKIKNYMQQHKTDYTTAFNAITKGA